MQPRKILKIIPPDIHLQNILSRELGISKILSQLLVNRGASNVEDAEKFLNPNLDYLLDPYSLPDMHKAIKLIRKAIRNKEKVMVFGDYDVDGITALTLLGTTLSKMGLKISHYLPHRVKEGYGLNKNILQLAKQKDIRLLITVDCGTNSHEQIKRLRDYNIDVIVTDHHELVGHDVALCASAIINPKIRGCHYKYRDLAGAGVAYKLCQAITGQGLFEDLDLVSLGTIADVVPLTGENRIIVKEGLLRILKTRRVGLQALTETSGIRNRKITSTLVSYILGPRINASGRMDTAETALKLLMSENKDEAERLAEIMGRHNQERQKIESKILQEACDLIDKEINFKEHRVIVLAKEDWHQGVLGIVASKLVEKFYRPVIVISLDEDLCKGSGRSIKNFHLFQALLECKKFLKTFGGHSQAAGLTITKNNIEEFKNRINRLAQEKLLWEDLFPRVDVDMELNLSDLNEALIWELEALEPFGNGNPEPLFLTPNLKLKNTPRILGRETLKFWVTDGNIIREVIGFGMASFKENLLSADNFDLVYTPRLDDWKGEATVLLEAKDIFFRYSRY